MASVSLRRVYQKVIFDMDGTLVDSRAVVERVWSNWALRQGVPAADILAVVHGRRAHEIVQRFACPGTNIELEAKELEAQELADVTSIRAVPGARRMLGWMHDAHWAVVTSATRELAARRLEAAGLPVPDLLISAEDVSVGKPHPEGYLQAMGRMQAPPENCLIFEDAPAGIAAAQAAGCDVVAIGATHPDVREWACPVVQDFNDVGFSLQFADGPRKWPSDAAT